MHFYTHRQDQTHLENPYTDSYLCILSFWKWLLKMIFMRQILPFYFQTNKTLLVFTVQ